MTAKKKALGRGLDALIADMDAVDLEPRSFFSCDINAIVPNPYQPRRVFLQEELEGLANSLKEKGIIQPLVVRSTRGGYEIITGERRWRAARLAGLKEVPVVVKEATASEMLEIALVENVQREDLNPLEKAEAYQRLTEEFGLTQEEVAKRVGQDRSTVANFLRLLKLPQPIQDDILANKLTMGHARALAGAETPSQQRIAWRRIVSKDLSVRAAETLIRKLKGQKEATTTPRTSSSEAIYMQSLAEDLTRLLGTKVHIARRGKKRGTLQIEFYGNDDLDRLITRLKAAF